MGLMMHKNILRVASCSSINQETHCFPFVMRHALRLFLKAFAKFPCLNAETGRYPLVFIKSMVNIDQCFMVGRRRNEAIKFASRCRSPDAHALYAPAKCVRRINSLW